jgi:hypothetical protein
MYIRIMNQFAIKTVYTILNSCSNFVIHMTDMYLTIQIQHNIEVYLTLTSSYRTALNLIPRV